MVEAATFAAVVLYFIPVAALILVLSKRETPLSLLALAAPTAIAIDLLLTGIISRVVRLELATFLSRAIYLAALSAYLFRARKFGKKFELPATLDWGAVGAIVAGAIIGFWVSYQMSRWYWPWDREWHVPFVASIRGQRIPFENVYEPGKPIHYHFAGDAIAAMFQSLSFDVMHASRALSISHDALTALGASTVALLVRDAIRLPYWLAGALGAMPALAGPLAIFPGEKGAGGVFEGFADFNNLTLTFRPGNLVGGLMLIAIAGLVCVRIRHPSWDPRFTLGFAFPLVIVLSLSDEISTAIIGLGLGIVWLARPADLGRRWWHGALGLIGIGVAILIAHRLYSATLVPGGPVNRIAWVAGRYPPFPAQMAPLWTPEALSRWLCDGFLICALGLALVMSFIRRQNRSELGMLLFPLFVLAIGVVAFFKIEFNARSWEAHRYLTAARHVLPVAALMFLPRTPVFSFQNGLTIGALFACALSTLGFVFARMPDLKLPDATYQYAVNCRRAAGSRFGEAPRASYIEEPFWYIYAGCHPIQAPGGVGTEDREKGVMAAGWPKYAEIALAELKKDQLSPGAPLEVVCSTRKKPDRICERAATLTSCVASGSDARVCSVAGDRVGEL